MKFYADRWLGNQWASIEIEPVDERYFLPLLTYLMMTYDVPKPQIVDTIDGYMSAICILGCEAILSVDTWSFSIAFAEDTVRDIVLGALLTLPADYFDS